MISHIKRYVFVQIPKTGTTSVFNALGGEQADDGPTGFSQQLEVPLQHLTATEMLAHGVIKDEEFTSYYKFCFVRNPWDRAVSEWKWRMDRKNFSRFSTHRYIQPSLRSFLQRYRYYRGELGHKTRRHLVPQYEFIYDSHDNLLVDYVGRFENITEHFAVVCHKIGVQGIDLPHANQSKREGGYRRYYDEETREIVREEFQRDITLFGYEF